MLPASQSFLQSLAPIDWVVGLILLIALIQGLRKGVIRQVFGLAALLVGCWGAWQFSGSIEAWLAAAIGVTDQAGRLLAYLITFLVLVALVLLIGQLADRLIRLVQLGWLNRLLGAVFALAKWLFIWVIILFLLQKAGELFDLSFDNLWKNSRVYPFFERLLQVVFPYLHDLGQ